MAEPRHGKAAEFRRLGLFSDIKNFAELERRIEALADEKQKGDAFEVFAEAYLATQRVGMAKHVWPDKVIPPSLRRRHQLRHGTVLVGGDEVKAQQVANQIALAQAVAEHQLKKIFTFHRNVASARSFTSEGSEGIGTHLPDFAALHVNGAMSTAARDGLMTEFKAARQAVMSNARCLTEGIDVPTVDMVVFLTIVGRRRRAGRVRRSLGRVAGPARTGRSARRPHPPDAGRATAHERFL